MSPQKTDQTVPRLLNATKMLQKRVKSKSKKVIFAIKTAEDVSFNRYAIRISSPKTEKVLSILMRVRD